MKVDVNKVAIGTAAILVAGGILFVGKKIRDNVEFVVSNVDGEQAVVTFGEFRKMEKSGDFSDVFGKSNDTVFFHVGDDLSVIRASEVG